MSWMEDLLLLGIGGIAVSVYGVVAGLLLLGIDRKLVARMQARIGPPIRQPFVDVQKLFTKQNIVPEHAVAWLFNGAPVVALVSSLVILLYLPIGSIPPVLSGYGDLILIMYLLTIPALALVAGGFSSGSPYATVGAQREMVTMISYELPLAIVFIAIAWRMSADGIGDPFSLVTIMQYPLWGLVGPLGLIGGLILLFILLLVTPAELSRIPFDTPEAETELAGGLLVEYSGKNLAMFYTAQGVKTLVMASILIALFLPWNPSGLLGLGGILAAGIDIAFFLLKLVVVVFASVTLVRAMVARFRITQVVGMYWLFLGLMGIIALILLGIDAIGGA
ncbi:MAG: NADH-quinone oxidoreductase subunit H [Methanomicrobiales archaeon]|nr:NADH-quinone oxidoreductase subunit H [Methanomicrobiales archaeon]